MFGPMQAGPFFVIVLKSHLCHVHELVLTAATIEICSTSYIDEMFHPPRLALQVTPS